MEQYAQFKKFTSTVDIQDMRAFLSGYLDMSYIATDIDEDTGEEYYVITDEFVAGEYLAAMEQMEKDMGNTTDLKPVTNREVDIDDL